MGDSGLVDSLPTRRSKAKRRTIFIRVFVSLSVLIVLIVSLPSDLLWGAFRRISFFQWSACLGGALAAHVIGVTKWRIQLRAAGTRLGFTDALRCHSAGLFANMFLPTAVGGDVLRAGLAMKVTRNKWSVGTGSLIDRLADVISLILIAFVGIVFLPSVNSSAKTVLMISMAGLICLGGAAIGIILFPPTVRCPGPGIRRRFVRLQIALRRVVRNYRLGLMALALSVFMQIIFVALNLSLGRSVGISIPLSLWAFSWPLSKIAALLPLSFGGVGIQETAMTGLLAPFGVIPALAAAQALLWRGIIVGTSMAGGVVWLLLNRLTVRHFAPVDRFSGFVLKRGNATENPGNPVNPV